MMKKEIKLPAEWYPQDAIMIAWPHSKTDWGYMLEEVTKCYIKIATKILEFQNLLVLCHNTKTVGFELKDANTRNLQLIEIDINDTWVRDYGFISMLDSSGNVIACDFTFNAWGLKFAADLDNQVNRALFKTAMMNKTVSYQSRKNFVIEGGAIESDGMGTVLTTSQCLLSPNRNPHLTKKETEAKLKEYFSLDRVLWLDSGFLAGDDTDSHIDTLARFCDAHTIAYITCEDEKDVHYNELKKMEEQLKGFVDYEGNPYRLIALPMVKACYDDTRHRLPATYANFLIMNDVVLLPFYNDSVNDEKAKEALEQAFPDKTIIGIDCRTLIEQHGSLHCITMQLPKGFLY